MSFFMIGRTCTVRSAERFPDSESLYRVTGFRVPGDVRAPDFAGMAELWFDSIDDLLAAPKSPEWRASGNDEPNLIDHSKVACFISEEHEIPAAR